MHGRTPASILMRTLRGAFVVPRGDRIRSRNPRDTAATQFYYPATITGVASSAVYSYGGHQVMAAHAEKAEMSRELRLNAEQGWILPQPLEGFFKVVKVFLGHSVPPMLEREAANPLKVACSTAGNAQVSHYFQACFSRR